MKSFIEWSNSLKSEEKDPLSTSDLRFNLDKTVRSGIKTSFKQEYPNLYKEVGRLSPEAKAELQDILKLLMNQSVSWGTNLGRKLR